jgi:hypothetical protein
MTNGAANQTGLSQHAPILVDPVGAATFGTSQILLI